MKKRRSGFTLVELLVVIGIIAVLIGILLPALNRARQQANKVACISNQRQIAIASMAYAVDNKGYLPEYKGYLGNFLDTNCVDYGPSGIEQQVSYYTSENGFGENEDGGGNWPNPNNNGAGMGRLIKKKYLGNSRKILVCPALGEAIVLNQGGNASSSYRAGYYYNPHPMYDQPWSDTVQASHWTTRYKKVNQIPKNRCLAIDFMYDTGSLGHFDRKTNTWYINVVYSDGHAVSVPNSYAYRRMINGGVGWSWVKFMDVVGATELLGAGQSIDGKQDNLFLDKGGLGTGNPNAFYSLWPQGPHN